MPQEDGALSSEQLEFFDGLAALTAELARSFLELRRRFEEDDRVRVPKTVVNSLRQREEPVLEDSPA